jgi:hypothetical protein
MISHSEADSYRRNRGLSWLLEEAKRRDEQEERWALEEEREAREFEAELIAKEEADKYERERVTLGEFYPLFAPGCYAAGIATDWYDDNEF